MKGGEGMNISSNILIDNDSKPLNTFLKLLSYSNVLFIIIWRIYSLFVVTLEGIICLIRRRAICAEEGRVVEIINF
jgi:hypothetical protein